MEREHHTARIVERGWKKMNKEQVNDPYQTSMNEAWEQSKAKYSLCNRCTKKSNCDDGKRNLYMNGCSRFVDIVDIPQVGNDLISRQVVKEQMIKYGFHAPDMTVTEFVEDLPSSPDHDGCKDCRWEYQYENIPCMQCKQNYTDKWQKKPHWIDDNENELDAQYGRHLYKCSECNTYANDYVGGTEDWWDIKKPSYCPNCGAKMD